MPTKKPYRTYCYRCLNGEVVDVIHRAGEAPDEMMIDNDIVVRDLQAEVAGMHVSVVGSQSRTRQPRNTWPMEPCVASGVHADQSQDLRDHLKANGCPTEVTGDGDPIYTSASHRKRALKIRGLHDNNSFG